MRKFILIIIILALSLTLYAETVKEELTLGFMPYLAPNQIFKKYQPLADYLSERTGKKVNIVIAKDYNAHLRATGEDRLDISFLGGSPYVNVVENYGKKPLLARFEFNHRPHFRSIFYTSKNSDVKSLNDLKGRRVVFGSRRSTLSTQVPLQMLIQAGLTTDDFTYEFLNNQENVYISVLLEQYEGGASSEEVFNEVKHKGLRAIAYSPYISTHVFVTRNGMDEDLYNSIKNALLDLKNMPDKEWILKNINEILTGFVDVRDSDYNLLRGILKEVQPILE